MPSAKYIESTVHHNYGQRPQQLALNLLAPNAVDWLHRPFTNFEGAALRQAPAATTNYTNTRPSFHSRRLTHGVLSVKLQAAPLDRVDLLSGALDVVRCIIAAQDQHAQETSVIFVHVQKGLEVG